MRTKRLTVRIPKDLDDFINEMVKNGKAKTRVGVVSMALELEMKEWEKNLSL